MGGLQRSPSKLISSINPLPEKMVKVGQQKGPYLFV